MDELASLRARVQEAEHQATTNKAAAELMSQMIVAGHVIQEADEQIVINAKEGVQRFGVGLAPHPIEPRQDALDDVAQDGGAENGEQQQQFQ